MANNYTLFSEVIQNLTDEEVQWLKEQIETNLDNSGIPVQFDTDDDPNGWGRHLWLYADESADLEQVAAFVQKFLRHFRPDRYWSLTFACTCSRPRVGEFSGGAVFITANDIKWQGSHAFIAAEANAFSPILGENRVSRLMQLAEQLGLEDGALDEIVHDAASEHAASVNNQGLVGQIDYLVSEVGDEETERVLNEFSNSRLGANSN